MRPLTSPVVVAYGAGVNSTALLLGLLERQQPPDAILFADTGGEKPDTYGFLKSFSMWLVERGFPPVVTVASTGKYLTLEANCLDKQMLPSIAYGRRACSEKYKQRPQHKWLKEWQPAVDCWASNRSVTKLLGFHTGEQHRATIRHDDYYDYRYPLIEWSWGQAECVAAIRRHELAVPPKSACFFCPSSTKPEVLQLARCHPELFARAVAMEQNAASTLTTIKGLGRRWSWEKFVRADQDQRRLFPDPSATGCCCHGEIVTGEGVDGPGEEDVC